MLSIGLADIIDQTDPCTPGSPNYTPNDPVCAATDQAIPLPSSEMDFDTGTTASSRVSCPSGYSLVNGNCVSQSGGPSIKPASAAGSSPVAAGILGSGISWWWLAGLAVIAGGGALYYHRKGSANKKLSGPHEDGAARARYDAKPDLTEIQRRKPRPLHKLYGKNPTPEQIAASKAEWSRWNSEHRRATKEYRAAVEGMNELLRRQRG